MVSRPPAEVTVVIPTRNRWHRLWTTLDGVLAQAAVSFEVVIVDDHSDHPAPPDLVADPRVRIVRNELRAGVAAARNRGVEEASGRWIAFLDDDDLWSPAKLVEQLQAASRQQADGVYSGAVAVDSQLNVVMAIPARSPGEVIERITTENVLATGQSNLLVRRELVRQLGGFDVNLSLLADWELWIRLVAAGRLAACPAIHVAYVMHHDNMSLVDRGAGREFEYVAGRHMPDRATRRRARISNSRWHAYNLRRSRHRLLAAREYLGTAITCLSVPMGIRAIGAVLDGRAISALRGHPPRPEVPWLERYHGVHAPIPATLPTLSASDTPQTQDDRQPR